MDEFKEDSMDDLEGEEEDWSDTRWAVPQNDPVTLNLPSGKQIFIQFLYFHYFQFV